MKSDLLLFLSFLIFFSACRKENFQLPATVSASDNNLVQLSGGIVLIQTDISDATLYALDARTGRLRYYITFPGRDLADAVPLVYDNKVLVTSVSPQTMIDAFNARTGGIVWENFITDSATRSSSAPIYVNGSVYFGVGNLMYSLNSANGKTQWVVDTHQDSTFYFNSPVIHSNTVYCKGNSTMYAFDATTGQQKWENASLGESPASSPAYINDLLYCSIANSGLTGIDTLGNKKLVFPLEGTYGNSSPTANSKLIFTHNTYRQGGAYKSDIVAVNIQTGKEVWRYYLKSNSVNTWPTGSEFVAGNRVFVSLRDSLLALDAKTGTRLWGYYTGNTALPESLTTSCCVANNIAFVVGQDNYLHAIDINTGNLIWKFYISTSPLLTKTAPVILLKDGTGVFPSESGMTQ